MGKKTDDAIRFAVRAHAGQMRKNGIPYILHPLEAAVIAGSLTNDEDVIAAALLHDVVEDTGVGIEQIAETFGKRVADLVLSETENKRCDLPPGDTWKIRKEETLERLKTAQDDGVRILWISDKLSNIRAIYAGVRKEGDSFFARFNQKDKHMHEWYYTEVAKALAPLDGSEAYAEFCELIRKVFHNKTDNKERTENHG